VNSLLVKSALLFLGFLFCFALPEHFAWGSEGWLPALGEALALTGWYAREHVLLCLLPAFFIAGSIGVFVRQAAVMHHLRRGAKPWISYAVASVSGSVLAVCSCTVLPLFAGIYRMGAGLGPATAFLYAGPAVNVLAIILTAQVLGFRLGFARAVGAIVFSVVIGLLMHFIFRRDEEERVLPAPLSEGEEKPLWKVAAFIFLQIAFLVFANWPASAQGVGFFAKVSQVKILLAALSLTGVIYCLRFFTRDEIVEWLVASRDYALQILPLLFAGVFVAGLLLGRPGHEGLIPSQWITTLLAGDSFLQIFAASLAGALMYFATLTEVPIIEGLLSGGMGRGAALALLLAGPALSLPNMLVIAGVLGSKKTAVFVLLVVVMSTSTAWILQPYL
jgi:uncharacterized protein